MTTSLNETRRMLNVQHLALRDLIYELRTAAAEVLVAGERTPDEKVHPLRACIGRLRSCLERHLEAEELLLGPVLGCIDAWGPQRLQLMLAEHAHQRAVLKVLTGDPLRPLGAHVLARRAWSLSEDILADMDAEDRDLLSPTVLTDDTIRLDQSDA